MLRQVLAAGMLLVVCLSSQAAQTSAWDSYKARFLMPDGRIIDTGNKNVTHTEGQGFAMLMAVDNNDRSSFDKIWGWTTAHLKNPDNGLFYWRYDPTAPNPISDKNNASDGDTLIAWALLKGGQQWGVTDYVQQSDAITNALVEHTVMTFAGGQVMLPGVNGFNHGRYVDLNPSYFLFPAWRDFFTHTHRAVWKSLLENGQKLLGKMAWGDARLPGDWVSLYADGRMALAASWPPRSSYDAIRIPLYLIWYRPSAPQLAPWRAWWQRFSRDRTPAWVNLSSNETANYTMQGGELAIRDLTLGALSTQEPVITRKDDYYSASLKMLAWMARKSQ